jgi:hypothetical protein
MYIYIGDSSDVTARILTCHCSGNVEGSALRKHIADSMGFRLSKTRRSSGTKKVRLDMPDPRVGEARITAYVRSGSWKYVVCASYEEANAFQWFAIEALNPLLNRDRRASDQLRAARFRDLLADLERSGPYTFSELRRLPTGSGVYALCHDSVPKAA